MGYFRDNPIFAFFASIFESQTKQFEHKLCTYLIESHDYGGKTVKNREYPSPKGDLYQIWLKMALWFWRRFLTIFFVLLLALAIISPWMICVKFG
jgi:hypothetical protein